MKSRSLVQFVVIAVLGSPTVAAAQTADPVMASVRPSYERVKEYLLAAAEQMSAADLQFQPTPEVRSGLAILAHVADSQHFFCSAALGEAEPHETSFERTASTTDATLEALRESFSYCDRAYSQSDEQALEPIRAFGGSRPRLTRLLLNATHSWEHYGNIATYMRLRGLVPPSSQPR
jgi:uncharacterized damage-inducible protein DinB